MSLIAVASIGGGIKRRWSDSGVFGGTVAGGDNWKIKIMRKNTLKNKLEYLGLNIDGEMTP